MPYPENDDMYMDDFWHMSNFPDDDRFDYPYESHLMYPDDYADYMGYQSWGEEEEDR